MDEPFGEPLLYRISVANACENVLEWGRLYSNFIQGRGLGAGQSERSVMSDAL